MRKFGFFYFCVLFASLNSQTPKWEWVNKVCSNFYSSKGAMAADHSGNVYVAGRYYQGPVTIENYTLTEGWPWSENLFMVKYDPNGKILWAKRIASAEGSLNVCEL